MRLVYLLFVVYLLIPTSNHNHGTSLAEVRYVVYLLIPTSNHNKPALIICRRCCISFDSYIKPQLGGGVDAIERGCISFDSYIKPQLMVGVVSAMVVVYLLIPTSNHNYIHVAEDLYRLYIF